MKLNKILAASLAVFALTACSDSDNDVNTAKDVTVSMTQDQMAVSEDFSAGTYYEIPVTVTGDTNGPVKVTIEVADKSEDVATEGTNFLITSKTITIPAGQNEAYFEFYPIGDDIVNEDRTFTVTITKAEGAEIGLQNTTVVTLVDNEKYMPIGYEALAGNWVMKDAETTWNLELVAHEEGEEGYLKEFTVYGIMGYPWTQITVRYDFDASTMQPLLYFDYGQPVAYNVSFTGLGEMDVMWAGVSDGYLVSSGTVVGRGSVVENFGDICSEVILPKSAAFVGALFTANDGAFNDFSSKVWFWLEDGITMKR